MVELRKRKAVGSSVPAPVTKKPSSVKSASKEKAKVAEKKGISTNGASSSSKFTVGGTIDFDGFGGEVETNDGAKTSLKKLVEDSESGVVLFTYPKASTPGCMFIFPDYCTKMYHFISIFRIFQSTHGFGIWTQIFDQVQHKLASLETSTTH